jgi:hypothetical protein
VTTSNRPSHPDHRPDTVRDPDLLLTNLLSQLAEQTDDAQVAGWAQSLLAGEPVAADEPNAGPK